MFWIPGDLRESFHEELHGVDVGYPIQGPRGGDWRRSPPRLNDIMYIIGQLHIMGWSVISGLLGTFSFMTNDALTTSHDDTLTRLRDLADPKILAVNERHGDDHAVNLTKLRGIAKDLKKNQELAIRLWASGDTSARLVALLICRPKEFTTDQLDAMLREARKPKVTDWLMNYVIKKHPGWNDLRLRWLEDTDSSIRAAGWSLNTYAVGTAPENVDPETLLKSIESDMSDAPERLQWSMNETLANIGIEFPEHRPRALDIGHRLKVLKDYPTPPNCTSPFAPIWIEEIVRRREAK